MNIVPIINTNDAVSPPMFVEHDDVAPGAKGTKKVHVSFNFIIIVSFFLSFPHTGARKSIFIVIIWNQILLYYSQYYIRTLQIFGIRSDTNYDLFI